MCLADAWIMAVVVHMFKAESSRSAQSAAGQLRA